MSSGGAPAPPDYTPIAQANQASAEASLQLGRDQLAWAKEQYADTAPYAKDYLTQQIKSSDDQTKNAEADRARYTSIYQPIEDKFVNQATTWNSPARSEQMAGAAKADVASSFDAARLAAQSSLESFGIDPSQTRFGALDLSSRVSQAAATAAAGTQSRLNTEATGLALEGEAINIGKGYPGNVAASYAGATSAGGSGVQSALNTSNTYGNLMGTPYQYGSLANQSYGQATSALDTGYKNQIARNQLDVQASGNTMSGIGSLVGAAAAVAGAVAI